MKIQPTIEIDAGPMTCDDCHFRTHEIAGFVSCSLFGGRLDSYQQIENRFLACMMAEQPEAKQ